MSLDFDPCLEIDPLKYLLIIGPGFTAAVLEEISQGSEDQFRFALTCKQLVTVGIEVLLTDDSQSDAEREKCGTLYRNAYELDPLFAVKKLSSSLQKSGKYKEWLKQAFDFDLITCNESHSLQKVKQLQQQGALVLYSHYDDILSRISKTKPITLNDTGEFNKWCSGNSEGILHLHGVYFDPETVVFDGDVYDAPNHPMHSATTELSNVFCRRHVLMLGFDSERINEDPLSTKFIERYIVDAPNDMHTIHATTVNNSVHTSLVHTLLCKETPGSCLLPLSHTSMAMWNQIAMPQSRSDCLALNLLVANKEGAMDISKVMTDAPGVNFALVSTITHHGSLLHTVSVRHEKCKQKEMWDWLLLGQRGELITKGLLALAIHNGTFLWMRGKPIWDTENPQDPTRSPLSRGSPRSISSSPPSDSMDIKPVLTNKIKEEPLSVSPHEFTFPKTVSRKVPRYTMHQVRSRHHPYAIPSPNPLPVRHGRPDVPSVFGQCSSRAIYERRASLPVNSINRNSAHNLDQLAHNLSPAQSHDLPSYAAIKQALLCDWYKRRRSIQVDPKMLKFLLKSKLMSEPLDLLKLRRYSDPGSYISQPESFARRKELFIDENRTWSQTYGKVIEQKITKWQARREERRQREMLNWKAGEYQSQGLKYHLLNSLQTNGVPHNMFPTGLTQAGINSYVYPTHTIFAPTSGALPPQAPSSMVYSPFITPYTLVNPYQSLVQPTTFYVPQQASPQKLVYLVPPANGQTGPHPVVSLNDSNQHLQASTPPRLTRKRSDSGVRDEDSYLMKEQFKRRQSVPNNLSSLLVSPLRQLTPDSPPPMKRIRLTDDPPVMLTTPTAHIPNQQESPKQLHLSSRTHHLLQVHRHQRNGDIGSRSGSRSPLTSPQSTGQCSTNSPTYQALNESFFDSDCSDYDEEEAEVIVGGAILSSNQHTDYRALAPQSQLQLWQFLLELLLISANTHLIQWTSNNFEFQINKPQDVAKLWGKITNNETMNYHKLLKGLHYYFSKGVMSKVKGMPLSFKFNGSIQSYIEMRRSNIPTQEEMIIVE